MGEDPVPSMSLRDLEEMEKQAAASLEAIRDRLAMAAMVADATELFAAVAAGRYEPNSAAVAAEEHAGAAEEQMCDSPNSAAVAAADEPVSGPPRLRLPVAKVYGAGPVQTGRPSIGAKVRRHVPKGASKWHKLYID